MQSGRVVLVPRKGISRIADGGRHVRNTGAGPCVGQLWDKRYRHERRRKIHHQDEQAGGEAELMTAEELLLSADTQSAESSERCVIDPESREINIPLTYQILGVESDEKTERIEFECPKIVGDNIDLTQLQLRINYQNANGEKDQYIIDDVTQNGDNVNFSWLLSRKVTAYRGTVSFIVCAVKVSVSTIENEWNTTLAEAQVLEGLEVETPSPSEEQSDVIAQLMQLVQNTSEQAVTAVQEAEAEAIEKISSLPYVENHIITFGSLVAQKGGPLSGSN